MKNPLKKLIGKKIVSIRRGETDAYGNGECVYEAYEFLLDDGTKVAIELSDPGETCYAHVWEDEIDFNDPKIKWLTKPKDLK